MPELSKTGAFAPAPLIAYLGDSIPAAYSSQDTSLVTAAYVYSPATWVSMRAMHRVRTRPDLIFATAGFTTQNCLDKIAPVLVSDADVVVVNCITNDVGNLTLAQTTANLTLIWDRLIAAGKVVIAVTMLSRDLASASNRDQMYNLMRWVKQQRYSGRRNFYVADPNLKWADPASATGAPLTYYSYDGLHPRGLGNYFYAESISAILDLLYPPVFDPGMTSLADVWSVDNPSGNLLPGGMMLGSAGANGGGGATITGTIPDNVTLSSTAGTGGTITSITVGSSLITMGDGTGGMQIVVGGTGTGSSASPGSGILVTQTIASPATKFSVGDVLEGAIHRIELDAGIVNLAGIRLRLRTTEGGLTYDTYDAWDTIADLLPPVAATYALRTPKRVLTAIPTAASLTAWISFRNQTAASFTGTVRIGRMTTRKVA